jgi:proline iminopeptidase
MTETSFRAGTGTGVIAGTRSGAGPALLMLHGGPGLTDYTGLLAGETAGWEVIRYQQRGVSPSATEGPLDVGQHVTDAIAVLDALGLDRVVVAGHSWGGHLALHLAVAAPERITALAAIDPLGAVPPDAGTAEFGRRLNARVPAASRPRVAELNAREPLTDAEDQEHLALLWPAYFADPVTAPPMPAGIRAHESAYGPAMESAMKLIADGFARRLPEISVPAVFVLGEDSPIPVPDGRETAALLPGAEVVVVPGAGHFPWIERPGCVAAALATLRVRAGLPGPAQS